MLAVPPAHAGYAKQFGAKFDHQQRQWFVHGDVPDELLSYVIVPARTRDYTQESAPACPKCHAGMVVRKARSGDRPPFWGCSRFPGCDGTRTMDDTVADTSWQRAPEPLFKPSSNDSPTDDVDTQLQHTIAETLILCRTLMPHGQQWKVWLRTPRVRFGHQSAQDVMITLEGCLDVQKLLHETFGTDPDTATV